MADFEELFPADDPPAPADVEMGREGVVVEIGEMAITAEVDGVVVALVLVALETTWHG